MNFTEIGKREGYTQAAIVHAAAHLTWEDMQEGKKLPLSQGMAIQKVITDCKMPYPDKVAVFGTIGINSEEHGFYGIEATYSNGVAKIYIADNGCSLTPVAMEFTPKR